MLTDDQIRYMTTRFLGWRLPEDFRPDGGVKFEPVTNAGTAYENRYEPVGTNLLTGVQAEVMIRHILDGLPSGEVERLNQRVVDAQACATVLADEVDRLTKERGQMVETIRTARQALKNGSHDAAFAILDSSLDAEPEPAP